MISNNRSFYLEQIWNRYPMAENQAICGRLTYDISEPEDLYFEWVETQEVTCLKETKSKSKSKSKLKTKLKSKLKMKLKLNEAKWSNQSEIDWSFRNSFTLPHPFEVLAPGDWVQLWGSQSSDQVMVVEKVLLLSPCLIQNPLVVANQELYRKWIEFLAHVSEFFKHRQFDEIKTPTLVICPGTEPFLEPFVTEFNFGQIKKTYYLPTSPELSLKKCLARGWSKIFEMRPCFRNGERSPTHLSEFFMLEWYRSFANLEVIKNDLSDLLKHLQLLGWSRSKLVTITMADLFSKYLDFKLTPATTSEDLMALVKTLNLEGHITDSQNWDFDDIFFLIYIEKIEPRLSEFDFLLLERYPPSQAALARLTPDGWGERFEFYIRGVEIANAFHELNDPKLQAQRFEEDLAKKRKHAKTKISIDEDFLQHLEQGMPPSSGIALGLERLFMMAHNIRDINQISPY